MKHRHLNHERFTTAAVDDILERGTLADWLPLLREVAADPTGPAAERVGRVVAHHPMYGTSHVWRRLIERSTFLPPTGDLVLQTKRSRRRS